MNTTKQPYSCGSIAAPGQNSRGSTIRSLRPFRNTAISKCSEFCKVGRPRGVEKDVISLPRCGSRPGPGALCIVKTPGALTVSRSPSSQCRLRSDDWLGCGRAAVEKIGDSRNKLGWREWLCQHDAVGDAFGRPISSARTTHIDDGKFRVDFSG